MAEYAHFSLADEGWEVLFFTQTHTQQTKRQRSAPARGAGTAASAEVTEELVLEYVIVGYARFLHSRVDLCVLAILSFNYQGIPPSRLSPKMVLSYICTAIAAAPLFYSKKACDLRTSLVFQHNNPPACAAAL